MKEEKSGRQEISSDTPLRETEGVKSNMDIPFRILIKNGVKNDMREV